jgi:hypothetical protein
MGEVVGVFGYFICFPHNVGTVSLDVGCDLCSVKLMLCLFAAECLATADHRFSSMVCLICSEILVEIWQPIWVISHV